MSNTMTQDEIYQALRAEFARRTGFYMEDNDDLAARLWAVAAQLAALRAENDWSDRQSFPQTAEGMYLDYHGQMRALLRRAGTCAEGMLRLYLDKAREEEVPIAAGTVCADAGLVRFVTLADAVIPAGETYVDVPARAEQPGESGNAAPGTIIHLTLPPTAVSGVTNPAAFTGGGSPEDDESYRTRILDSYRRLPNGANAAWYEARALAVEGVAAVAVLPRWQGIGTVGVVVTGAEGAADEALLAAVSEVLQSAREIATDVTVMPPETVPVTVAAQITVAQGYNARPVLSAVDEAVSKLFDGGLLGKPLYRAALGRAIYAVPGVENYVLTAPVADIAVSERQLPVLASLNVTEAAPEVGA